MKIHHILKNLREQLGFRQTEIAHHIELNQNTYHLIETGASKLKLEDFIKICTKLNADPIEILNEAYPDLIRKEEINGKNSVQDSMLVSQLQQFIQLLSKQLAEKDTQILHKDIALEKLINLLGVGKKE